MNRTYIEIDNNNNNKVYWKKKYT